MYNSTLLAAENTKEEIQKADLDLLSKINEQISANRASEKVLKDEIDVNKLASKSVFSAARIGAVASTSGVPYAFASVDEDVNNCITLATGRFTAPKDGLYLVTGYSTRNTAAGGTLYLWKNGVSWTALLSWVGATYACGFSTTVRLVKDGYVDIRPDGSYTLINSAIQFTWIGV